MFPRKEEEGTSFKPWGRLDWLIGRLTSKTWGLNYYSKNLFKGTWGGILAPGRFGGEGFWRRGLILTKRPGVPRKERPFKGGWKGSYFPLI